MGGNKEIFDNLEFTQEEFFKLTGFDSWSSNNREYNFRRAQMYGFEGNDVQVQPGAIVHCPIEQVGKNVLIGLYSYIAGNVTIGDNVLLGPRTSLAAGNHKFDPKTGYFSARTEPFGDDSIVIGDGCWLASNVTVTGGVRLGKANLVCAGAVVTKSTPDYAIMAGVPACQIGEIDPVSGEYIWFSHK